MRKTKIVYALALLFILSSFQAADAQRKPKANPKTEIAVAKVTPPKISFKVSMPEPNTHLFDVEMTLESSQMPEKAEVKMPVWTPGSYLIREYSRQVQDFSAAGASGDPLTWIKTSKNTWQVNTAGSKLVRVKYRVYSNELTVRTNELNDNHGFFTPAALLMYPGDFISAPSTVKIEPYGDWKVATGLPKVPSQTNTFYAENYDVLFDSPFEISNFHEKSFSVLGKQHRFVFSGEGNYNIDKIIADTTKIIEEAAKIFGELPYEDYTFIVNLRGGGGLEHLNSTALQWNRFGFQPESGHKRFLSLVAHEYFHLFNVKRIRPVGLGPFNYEKENYTRSLWVAEGLTSYYENVLLRRAGIIDGDEVLGNEAGIIEGLYRRPGRFETSAEEASFDAWIKYYRPDENSVNNQISYYDKGDVLNFLLDIEIRSGSNGAKSIDDVMRYLYAEYYKKGKGYTPEEYQTACELMAGRSLEEFFSRYVRGREDIDYNSVLSKIGLSLAPRVGENNLGYFGANLSEANGGITVSSVPSDSPAYKYGINSSDLIIAVDDNQANLRFFTTYLASKKAGDKIKVSLFRNGVLRELDVTLGKTPPSLYRISRVGEPTPEQKVLYEGILGVWKQ